MSKLRVKEIAHSNGTNAMAIDTSGRVTKPQNPVFHVGYTDGLTCTNADTFYKFTGPVAYVNQGSHFDITNNYFLVPVTGMYMLYGSLLRNSNQLVFRATFRNNDGSAFVTGASEPQLRTSEGYSGYQTSATFNHICSLTKDQRIVWGTSCDTAGGQIYDDNGGNYNFFGGYLIG